MKIDLEKGIPDWREYGTSITGYDPIPLLPLTAKSRRKIEMLFRKTETLILVDGSSILREDAWLSWLGQWKPEFQDVPPRTPRLTRMPQEKTTVCQVGQPFLLQGKQMEGPEQLMAEVEKEWIWKRDPWGYHGVAGMYRDCYGRKVVGITERFETFDIYDKMYDDRFYRYFYLVEGFTMNNVFFADGAKTFVVREDAASIRRVDLGVIRECGWLL